MDELEGHQNLSLYDGEVALTLVPDFFDPFTAFTIYFSDPLANFHHALGDPGDFGSMSTGHAVLFQHDVDLLSNPCKSMR